jgi:hypothetical protein
MVLDGGLTIDADAADGQKLVLSVRALEPVMDIALLGSPDGQSNPKGSTQFDQFVERTAPVPLFRGDMKPAEAHERPGPLQNSLPAMIFNHNRQWVKATASILLTCPRSMYQWL